MLIFAVGAGVAACWFWFLAPDHLSDRARHIGGTLGLVVCIGCMGLTMHAADQMHLAVRNASAAASQRDREKMRLLRQSRDEDAADLGARPPALEREDHFERKGFRGPITN